MSDIKQGEVEFNKQLNWVKCTWFIPEHVPLDAQMINDIGDQVWSKMIRAVHKLKLPGGTFVELFARPISDSKDPIDLLSDFTDCIDTVLEIWRPDDPFTFLPEIRRIAGERWSQTSGHRPLGAAPQMF